MTILTDLERLIQAADARAAAAERFAQATIDALARAAFSKLWRILQDNPDMPVREAIQAAQVEFGGSYAQALAEAFSELLQRSIGVAEVRALPVGEITLSAKIYRHDAQTVNEVASIVREHAQGLLQARRLSIALYDGYNPQDGVRRPLEGRARAELPRALRELTADPRARRTLTAVQVQGQKQAARLKTTPLRAAYLEAFEAWKKGAGTDALKRRLEVAHREKNRYFADRIAQTELHRAHQAQVARELMDDELTTVVQVKINPSHPRTDVCDLHARADLWGLGAGCYPKEEAPRPPYHPFCRCRLKMRPSLDARDATRVPGGEAAYLRSLGDASAARVMGSEARADAVLAGASAVSVLDAGVPAAYRTTRVGSAKAGRHALLKEQEKA